MIACFADPMMGSQMFKVLVLLVATLACTEGSRYMNTDDGARHRLWPLPVQRPYDLQDDTTIRIWPMPAQVTRGNASISVSPYLDISLSVAGLRESQNSFIIADAFSRYKHIIFLHAESEFDIIDPELRLRSEELFLGQLVVNVSLDDDTLDFETDESYHLYVPSDFSVEQAYLQANTIYGAIHGLETFSQLCAFNFSSRTVEIKNAPWDIVDSPRFKFRGVLIDTSRHYQPLDAIKQVIDSMAYAKFNVLHWHIVDEESFPIEIPSLPKLWAGAYTPLERYTIADAREIVGYAKARGIKVMAEIDVPGHAESWGYGYPDLWPSPACREPLDVSKNFTFEVIDKILTDFRKIFPFGLFHLGGDEVNTDCWDNTPEVKQWLDDQEMTAHEAYVFFVLRAQQIALSHGWEPVNWEETFNEFADMLDPRTIVHNWLGPGVAPKVVAKGFRCIVSNQDVWYLDHLDVPWQSFYTNEPLDGITNSTEQELVLGGEVCMWGETVDASDLLQTIWPRAAAAAERLWSPVDYTSGSLDEVEARLEYFRCVLNQRNIAAAPVTNHHARAAPQGPGSCYFQ
eukprot:c25469_g1_i1 orf=161-1873(+)